MSRASIYAELPLKGTQKEKCKLLPKHGSPLVAFGPVFADGFTGFFCVPVGSSLHAASLPYLGQSVYSIMFPAGSPSFMDRLSYPCEIWLIGPTGILPSFGKPEMSYI